MLRQALSGMVVAAMGMGGCQAASAKQPVASVKPAAATEPQAAASTAPARYTHARAVALYRAAKYVEDEKLCLDAVAAIEKTSGPKSRDLAEPLDDLATIYLRLTKFKQARPVIERAESVLDPAKPADALLLGRLAINKGWLIYSLGDVGGAEKVFADGRDLIEKNQKGDSVDLAELINNLALTYDDSDNPDEPPAPERVSKARVLLFKSWEMRKKLTGAESAESDESLNNIGMHLLYHGEDEDDLQTAVDTLKKSLEISRKVYGADHPETAISEANLAMALKMADDADGARVHARKALAMTEKAFGKDHLDRAYELQLLGELDEDAGAYAEAEKQFKEAVRINEAVFGPNHPNVANPLQDLRELYETMGEGDKEKAVDERIQKLVGRDI